MKKMCKAMLALSVVFTPIVSLAAVPAWQIVPSASQLTFSATQNGAPVTGQFKTFTGEINFDPNQLAASHVKIVVDISSITDPYHQLSDTLKAPEWFNVKVFPQAIFESSHFSKTGDKIYQAEGMLTIRDKKLPITLTFNQEEYTETKARMKGSTTIKRTAFGVGQGQWADTKTIKDEVKVDFVVTGEKAKK